MTKVALLLAVITLMFAVGCSSKSATEEKRENASRASQETVAASAAQGSRSETNQPESAKLNPASSGGSSLQASMPYSQPNAPAASQNLNAAPFLTTAESAATRVPAPTWSPALTSRADGTMYGPGDRPAAGIGQGMMAAPQSAGRPSKKAAPPQSSGHPSKKAAPPK
jgi:hypothetical protein